MDTISVPLKGFKVQAKIRNLSDSDTKALLNYIGPGDTNYVKNQLITLFVDNYVTEILTLVVKLTPRQRKDLFDQLVEAVVSNNKTLRLRKSSSRNDMNIRPVEGAVEAGGETKESEVLLSTIGDEALADRIRSLAAALKSVVIGQEHVIDEIQTYFECSVVGTRDEAKPKGSVLFVGDSGVGKTYAAKEIAKHLFGVHWQGHFFVINGSEFAASHETSKLLGSPPGYVGHNDKPAISTHFAKHPDSILLVDEFEKANDALQDLFLHILDEGYMTDAKGNKVDFTKAFIIFTSNIGTKEVIRKNPLGFTSTDRNLQEEVDRSIRAELKEKCRPEFLKRFDEVFVFNLLKDEDMLSIVRLEVSKLTRRVIRNNPSLDIVIEECIYELILDSTRDVDGPVSARDIAYAVRKKLEIPLAKCLLSSERDKKLKVFCESSDKIGVIEEETPETAEEN